ncbi:MAG: family NAD(P)-dependent oxidoreductase [Verrucomicrobiota bacterium]|nr:family NAD(P)-dependent oxidoreductase [Verrucomicrobiota bacterium]
MNIFITGGTSGLGAALAELYLSKGARVGVCGGTLEIFKAAFPRASGQRLEFYELDVRDRDATRRVLKAFSAGQTLDCVIASAGVNNGRPRDQIASIDFDREHLIFDVNLKGFLHTVEAALEVMLPAKKGQIVAIASAAAYFPLSKVGAYCASKMALVRYCESLAMDLKKEGITVSCIAPGYIDTPLARATQPGLDDIPFLMAPVEAARLAFHVIEGKKELVVIPWGVRYLTYILARLPKCVRERLLRPRQNRMGVSP